MVRKKVEGDEDERRAAANEAERAGERPSAQGETTGASKQRRHVKAGDIDTHEEKLGATHRGKQDWRAGDLAEEELVDTSATEPSRTFSGRGKPSYGAEHERVFQALAAAEQRHEGQALPLQDIAEAVDMPQADVRMLLHDLVTVHGLVTEIQSGSTGAVYQTAPRP